MGAQQLCLRIVALMAMPPPSAVYVLGDSFAGLANKVPNRLASSRSPPEASITVEGVSNAWQAIVVQSLE